MLDNLENSLDGLMSDLGKEKQISGQIERLKKQNDLNRGLGMGGGRASGGDEFDLLA